MEKQVIHVVGFSGGIDSQACARWVLNRFPDDEIVLLNSDAGGNEHPMTTEFIKWYSGNIHPVIELKAKVKDLEKELGDLQTSQKNILTGITELESFLNRAEGFMQKYEKYAKKPE